MARLAALTGATGFLGGQVALALAGYGWRLRLLARRDLADVSLSALRPEVVRGDLADAEALQRLCSGAQAIIHVAGLVKARRPSLFQEVNVAGAERLAGLAREVAPGASFLLVSSLAARAPHLSAYARSKRDGELAVRHVFGDSAWIVRPPAVYGPGDREILGLFRAAAISPVLPVLRREPRVPQLHVQDAAAAIATLAALERPGRTIVLCDGRLEGYALHEIMSQAALAMGRTPRLARVPEIAVRAVGAVGDLAAALGATPMVGSGKVRELLDGDWTIGAHELAEEAPPPRFGMAEGFRSTVDGYRAAGWLT